MFGKHFIRLFLRNQFYESCGILSDHCQETFSFTENSLSARKGSFVSYTKIDETELVHQGEQMHSQMMIISPMTALRAHNMAGMRRSFQAGAMVSERSQAGRRGYSLRNRVTYSTAKKTPKGT